MLYVYLLYTTQSTGALNGWIQYHNIMLTGAVCWSDKTDDAQRVLSGLATDLPVSGSVVNNRVKGGRQSRRPRPDSAADKQNFTLTSI